MYINKNKTIIQISHFTKDEWKKCAKYILANNTFHDIQLLIKLIYKLYPYFEINKETLFKKIYKNSNYQDYRIRNLFYRLDKSIQEFLIVNTKEDNNIHHLMLIRKLKSSKNDVAYNKFMAQLHANTSINNYFIAYEKLEKSQTQYNRSTERNFQEVNFLLDIHFINEKLKLACATLNDSRINNKQYNLGILSLIEDNLDLLILDKKSITYLLYKSYLFQKYDNEDAFRFVLQSLHKTKLQLSEELHLIFTMCNNFCIRFINKQKLTYFHDLFALYKIQIVYKSIYDQNNIIQATSINNIITVALRVEEYSWAEKFIQTNKNNIDSRIREETYNYLISRLSFAKKDFNKALQLLLITEPKDFLNNLSFRVLQTKCWHELDNVEQIENTLENFRLYLLRHKSKTYHYSFHIHFIKYMKQIIKAGRNNKIRKELLLKLQNETQVAEKSWLLSLLK